MSSLQAAPLPSSEVAGWAGRPQASTRRGASSWFWWVFVKNGGRFRINFGLIQPNLIRPNLAGQIGSNFNLFKVMSQTPQSHPAEAQAAARGRRAPLTEIQMGGGDILSLQAKTFSFSGIISRKMEVSSGKTPLERWYPSAGSRRLTPTKRHERQTGMATTRNVHVCKT